MVSDAKKGGMEQGFYGVGLVREGNVEGCRERGERKIYGETSSVSNGGMMIMLNDRPVRENFFSKRL